MFSARGLTRPGLSPVDFDVATGECVTLRGPSGGGKSLLLRALADLDPNQGTVELAGRSRADTPAPAWRRDVAYVPSQSGWWADQVGDHFDHWPAVAPLLDRLLLSDAKANWRVARLSTGEKQRLALIRALLRTPRVLLLDEPTSGLDDKARDAVEALIAERLTSGACALWVTHDARQAARISKRCLWVDGGRVTLGSPLGGKT